MFDINTIFAQALAAAVAEAVKPLLERIAALENNPAIGVDTTLAARVTALEENRHMTAAAFVNFLDQQEWFWEKLQNFVDSGVEKSMDNHLECYNHDDYDSAVSTLEDYDFDDFLTKDELNSELRDQINDTLNNATVSISV